MKFIYTVFLAAVLFISSFASCQAKTTQVSKDTTITYSIDGIASEGAEAITKYNNGKIRESRIRVYGETGQSQIRYVFSNNRIEVEEKEFTYRTGIQGVKFKGDMTLKKVIRYKMNNNGVITGKINEDRADIFQEFKATVPFDLNKVK